MGFSKILIIHDQSTADMTSLIQKSEAAESKAEMVLLQSYFNSLAGGSRHASVMVGVGAVKASGTVTFSGTGAANDTIIINGVTFTAKASGATGNEWNVGASATLSAAAAAAAINASATALISGYVTASASEGVLTITAGKAGIMGNTVTIAEGVDGSSHMAVSGARLTGGSEGTEVTYSMT